jgi:hypothetical protein
MKKIPTLFVRDEEDRRYVTDQVTPGCEWVLAGEGVPTRKTDGTCCMYDGERWWARREVKPGKTPPPNYEPIETDPNTGKTVGWEPMEQSAFARWHAEAVGSILDQWPIDTPQPGGTYELIGPKVNGNPERVEEHMLVRHGYRAAFYDEQLRTAGRDFVSLRDWLLAHPAWEGIVWHHEDGRMAKLKLRDIRRPDPT